MCESVFKVLIIGDSGVGKTSMVARYCHNRWIPNYKATLGADYAVKTLKWSERETIRMHLWDIAGQEHFKAMARTYFRGASGCVVMFDVTRRESFSHTRDWKEELDSKVVLPSGRTIPCILAANKDDLPDKCVSSHELSKFAKENGFFSWMFISVKDNKDIPEMMMKLVEQMVAQENSVGMIQQAEDRSTHIIRLENSRADPEGCFCAR